MECFFFLPFAYVQAPVDYVGFGTSNEFQKSHSEPACWLVTFDDLVSPQQIAMCSVHSWRFPCRHTTAAAASYLMNARTSSNQSIGEDHIR